MNHKQNYLLSTSNFIKFFFYILPLTSFFFTLYQFNLQYDGHHHGVVFSVTEDFLDGKVLYKDYLPHYGVFFILINSIFVKIFSNSIYGIYFLISLCQGSIFLIFGLIIKRNFNEKIAVSAMTMMFLLSPVAAMPWPDYLFMALLLLSFYILIISKNNFLFLLSGILFSLAGLTKDNFTILLFVSLILLCISLFYLKYIRKKILYKNLINIYWLSGYLIPLIIFSVYLSYNSVWHEYFHHFSIGKAAINHFCKSEIDSYLLRIFDCGWIALTFIFKISIMKIFTEPYWLFFLLIISTNLFFIIDTLFLNKGVIISKKKILLIWISFLCLMLFSNVFYWVTIKGLFTGVGVGMIVLIYLIQNLKSPITKYLLHCLLLAFLINGIQFARTENNRIYPTFSDKGYNYSNNIKFLKFKKLSNKHWTQLNEFDSITKAVINNCSFINYSASLTNDVFYRIILKQNFELLNFIPFGPGNAFISALYKDFDPDFYKNFKKEINKDNIIIAIDNVSEINIILKNNQKLYLAKSIKYNGYGTKFINIYLPKNCKI